MPDSTRVTGPKSGREYEVYGGPADLVVSTGNITPSLSRLKKKGDVWVAEGDEELGEFASVGDACDALFEKHHQDD